MKELSIEEKANAYDKVREKIALRFGSNVAEEIFSEFEMSEDEKIKEYLISFIKMESGVNLSPDDAGKFLAWLEKQGQKPAWSEEDEEMYQNIHECLKNGWRKLPTDLLKYESWIESLKQRIGG